MDNTFLKQIFLCLNTALDDQLQELEFDNTIMDQKHNLWHNLASKLFLLQLSVRYVGQRIRSHIMHLIILNNEYIHKKTRGM